MLLRTFVGKRLAEYYAQPANAVVGSTTKAIDMASLWGELHWKHVYRKLYREQRGQWLTPVELFKPFYSQVIGNFIQACFESDLASSASSATFDIVELGGGRGTNAVCILEHIQATKPELYRRLSYTIIDSSPSLLELQKQTLLESGHADVVHFENKSLVDVAESRVPLVRPSERPTVVLALELFDNLPHDKIRVRGGGRHMEQAEVVGQDDDRREIFAPLSDPLLRTVLQMASAFTRRPITWVPSVAYGVLNRLAADRPNAQLLVADFDWLPPSDSLVTDAPARASEWAQGEPLVTSMNETDYDCYLQAPRCCDILFPTDFAQLSLFTRKAWRDRNMMTRVHKQADFLQVQGPEIVHSTRSWLTGYSPLLGDFSNCSVLTVRRSE